MNDPNLSKILENVCRARDDKRPEMATVVGVLGQVLPEFGFEPQRDGPDQWSWSNNDQADHGFQCWVTLSGSQMEGTEGYPMVTIAVSTAPRMDAWLTTRQLVIGPSAEEVEHSVMMALRNHRGAFDGLQETVIYAVEAMGGTDAAAESLPDYSEGGSN